MGQRLFAFWRYDGYPTKQCLGGVIKEMRSDGYVETENYGKGTFFKPFLILPEKEGIEKLRLLESLDDKYHDELMELKNKYAILYSDIIDIPQRR